MAIIDFLENDADFKHEVDTIASNIPKEDDEGFKCKFCDKVCLSKGGLTRHTNSEHDGNMEKLSKEENIVIKAKLICLKKM